MVYTNFSRRKISSHYKWTFAYRLAGCFRKNKSPPTYIGKLQRICEGIPLNSRKKLFPLNQGHENSKVRGA